jgi:hypothetical protein
LYLDSRFVGSAVIAAFNVSISSSLSGACLS